MNVTLCSAFRNASGYIPRYFAQLDALEEELQRRGDFLALVFGYGDSVDDTGHLLRRSTARSRAGYCAHFVEVNHGQLDYGSVVHPIRFASLCQVWEQIWARIPESTDAIVFIEADLVWEPSVILALIDHLADVPAVAPLIMLQREGYAPSAHYDSWGMRKDGKLFTLYPPYFDGWPTTEMTQLDSAGSCVVMRGEYARTTKWRDEDLIVGICQQIRELGGSVWLDPLLSVKHL